MCRAGDGLSLTGYNMETAVIYRVDAEITEAGKCVFPARLFGDIIRRLPEGPVTVVVSDDYKVSIRAGYASFTISAESAEDYPELPDVNSGRPIRIPQNKLKELISGTLFAVSENQGRPIHTGVKFEIEHKSMSKLIRKTDDIAYDSRSLTRAATESRHGTIEECMKDFRMNPMFGMGFQMSETHRFLQKEGKLSYFSAPIEKGLLPLMILGETGIVGAMVFLYFLCAFFSECKKRGYVVTATMMLVFLATNMAEATFFSPGGAGGVFWFTTVGAGFVVDMAIRTKEGAIPLASGVKLGMRPRAMRHRTRIRL